MAKVGSMSSGTCTCEAPKQERKVCVTKMYDQGECKGWVGKGFLVW